MSRARWLLLVPLSGCAFISADHEKWRLDPDGDGVDISEDCDSSDASVGAALVWHLDLDGDGYGDPDNTVEACERPDNAVANSDDCWDDADNIPDDYVALNGLPQPDPATVYPGAENALYDGINQSCAEGFDLLAEFDGDGDGYASAFYADRDGNTGEDCVDNDEDPNLAGLDPEDVNPDATEVFYDGTDADCDGNDCDADGDGYDGGVGSKSCSPVDCDDTDATISPDASVAEIFYNGVDDNCDISVGDQDGDQDGDGYWADDYEALVAASGASPLDIPEGSEGDCWDDPKSIPDGFDAINGFSQPTAAECSPGGTEAWWDGVDQDCDGGDDFDADGDGYAYDGYPNRDGRYGDDCYDAVDQPVAFDNLAGLEPALVNSGAIENYYDGTDANCDGNDDDQDEDGYVAQVAGGNDCDDENADTYPGAAEIIADGYDNDCNGAEFCYADSDGDGYRSDSVISSSDGDCDDAGEALASDGDDCDDSSDAAYPGASIVCEDGIPDNDCDGDVDDECLLEGALRDTGELSADGVGDILAMGSGGDLLVGSADEDVVYVVSGPITGDVDMETDSFVYQIAGLTGDASGSALSVGDIDGDSVDDLLIGAPESDYGGTNAGMVWVVYGSLYADQTLSTSADDFLYGASSLGYAGQAVATGGDVNGDGYDDIFFSVGSSTFYQDWDAYLFYGTPSGLGGLSTSRADASWQTSSSSNEFGASLAIVADMDGDGSDELVAGAPGSSQAYLFFGDTFSGSSTPSSADLTIVGESNTEENGSTVASGGDLDGDGYSELLIGAASGDNASGSEAGRVYVLAGQLSGYGSSLSAEDAGTWLYGTAAGDQFGASAQAIDVSGGSDLLIGAPGAEEAYLFYGPLSGQISASDADAVFSGSAGSDVGAAVAGGEDLTGDGWSDIAVGAPGSGLVYFIEGTGY